MCLPTAWQGMETWTWDGIRNGKIKIYGYGYGI